MKANFRSLRSSLWGALPLRPAHRPRSAVHFALPSSQEVVRSTCPATPVSLLSFDVEKTSTEMIVHWTGNIISNTCTLFQDTIRNLISERRCIVVDLSNVSFIDSSGLGALASLWASARKRSADMDIRWREPHFPCSSSDLRIGNFKKCARKLFRLTRWVLVLVLSVAGAARLDGQSPTAQSMVEMKGVKPSLKLQTPLEGFMTALNGKLDMRASEVAFQAGGEVRDHYHYGPGIRRVLAGELTLVYAGTNKQQVVRAGDYFYESGDVNIWAVNRGTQPARLLIVELVPANWKTSAMAPLPRRSELEESGSRLKQEICSQMK